MYFKIPIPILLCNTTLSSLEYFIRNCLICPTANQSNASLKWYLVVTHDTYHHVSISICFILIFVCTFHIAFKLMWEILPQFSIDAPLWHAQNWLQISPLKMCNFIPEPTQNGHFWLIMFGSLFIPYRVVLIYCCMRTCQWVELNFKTILYTILPVDYSWTHGNPGNGGFPSSSSLYNKKVHVSSVHSTRPFHYTTPQLRGIQSNTLTMLLPCLMIRECVVSNRICRPRNKTRTRQWNLLKRLSVRAV